MIDQKTEVVDIDLAGPTSPLTITWGDGHTSRFQLEHLRLHCPCAECTDHGAKPMADRLNRKLTPPQISISAISEVGSYALTITWADGHTFGIYSWDYLRELDEAG